MIVTLKCGKKRNINLRRPRTRRYRTTIRVRCPRGCIYKGNCRIEYRIRGIHKIKIYEDYRKGKVIFKPPPQPKRYKR